jgi:hypothetical protein
MATTLFMITARIPAIWNDGRDPCVFWGEEAQFHAIRETAEAACRRLRAGGAYGVRKLPEYGVSEVTRADFTGDCLGADEWSHACHQAGIDPKAASLEFEDCLRR